MNRIRAIAFDCDGCLVSAKEYHFEALNKALEKEGFPPISIEDHVSRFDGLPSRKKLQALGLQPDEIERVNGSKQAITLSLFQSLLPNPELAALLHLLSKHYPLACCSNSIRKSLDVMLTQTGIRQYFPISLSNEDVEHPKPFPDIYIKCAALLNIPPSSLLVVEDNDHGRTAAFLAGCPICPVRSPSDVTFDHIQRSIWAYNALPELTEKRS